MSTAHLLTNSLELVPKTRADVLATIEAMDPHTKAQLSADWLALFRAAKTTDPWILGFSAVHRSSGSVVGTGGFKGPPAAGMVEIAYGVDADHQRQGYASEIAAALVGYAFTFAEVGVIRAHTLPDSHASKHVLAKCGFEHVGEIIDPEDGLVLRFEKRRDAKSGLDLDDLVKRFIACTLPKAAWTHLAHLAVGYWHVETYGGAEALTRLRVGIRHLNDSHGMVNSASSGYHETVTRAYVQLLLEYRASCPADRPLTERVARLLESAVADRHILLRFYSRDRLFSEEARARWVEPDLAVLRLEQAIASR
jgi:RimJ/RimL family protein N-acetyltransferase